ncbi:hypothetical protein [Brevibacillus laterosporus]|uniref:hypothetical protein n=1 Tax=Brevibacillus laterosporus TaxID=1465 RepID=UPI00265623AA|nr:hypothetical protein [Brevibacillus laterosporus]MDN9010181.1 hypothetical protein [Brevibacillus laterosporus]MDO0941435.1 hypothetical protein [Brevibacillus laterosporus]
MALQQGYFFLKRLKHGLTQQVYFYDKRGSAKHNLLIIINETFCLSGADYLLFHDDDFSVEMWGFFFDLLET